MIETRAFRYCLPMRPIQIAGRTYRQREGLLLCDAESGWHWGEAAPFPGFSTETIEDVLREWQHGPPYRTSSLKFALSTIAVSRQWCASREGIADRPPLRVPVNALIQGPLDEVVGEARVSAEQGYRAVKLKVGGHAGGPAESAESVRRVREALRPEQQLRLDANRCWTLTEAIAFAKGISDCEIEYIEEPLCVAEELERFWDATGVPYALDETLRETECLERFPHAAALILKPTILGDVSAMQPLTSLGIPLVFSGAFESGIGTLAVARLSNRYAPGVPAGLDAHARLESDVLAQRLSVQSGDLLIPARVTVDFSRLTEVERHSRS